MEKINVILDTDTYNEADDQFALAYLLKSQEKCNIEAITIAPFSKSGYAEDLSIEGGINKSYDTTLNILKMLNFAVITDTAILPYKFCNPVLSTFFHML